MNKKSLYAGCLLFSLGLVLLFIPFPNSRRLMYGEIGISEDTQLSVTETFPMFSTHQVMDIYIYALNGSFSLFIMDREEYYKWAENRPSSALYFSNNLTYFNEKISVSSLNKWPYLGSAAVIKPHGLLVITVDISIRFFDHYLIQAISLLSFASLLLIFYFYRSYKLRIRKTKVKEID